MKNLNESIKLAVFLLCCFPLTISAQTNDPKVSFTTINTFQGQLPNNNINDILEDPMGFIWIATSDGLCRYESHNRTKVFLGNDPHLPNGLQSSVIRTLFLDSKDHLWIGTTFGGLTRYHLPTDTWTTFTNDPKDSLSISNNEILCISEDERGNIWVGTEYGLNIFDPESENFIRFLPQKGDLSTLNTKAILSVYHDKYGFTWLGSWGGGFYLAIPSKNHKIEDYTFKNFLPSDDNRSHNVWRIYQDNDYRYWIGTHGGGLFLMDLPKKIIPKIYKTDWQPEFYRFLYEENDPFSISYNTVQDIYQDKKGNIWVGTTSGLNLVKESLLTELKYADIDQFAAKIQFNRFLADASRPTSLANNGISSIIESKQGILWVGTYSGVSQYNWYTNQIDAFGYGEHISNFVTMNNLYVDPNEIAWIGNSEKGLIQYNLKTKAIEQTFENKLFVDHYINAIHSPDDIHLYLSTPKGISIFNLKNYQVTNHPFPESIQGKTVNFHPKVILTDSYHKVWIGSENGLISFDMTTEEWHYYQHDPNDASSISDNSITSILEDSRGNIWLSTYNGLNRIIAPRRSKVSFETFKHDSKKPDQGIPSNRLICLKEIKGLLYIGMTSGLCSYDLTKKKFIDYTKNNDKHHFNSIEADRNENIWAGTSEGIVFFNTKNQSFSKFEKQDGLIELTFNIGSSHQGKDGYLYFGSCRGITRFHPDKIFKNNTRPPVFITEATTMNPKSKARHIDMIFKDEIILNHNDYYLSLNFAALNYNRSEKNQYAYQLVGLDKKWIYTSNNSPVVYTNLSAGEYTFKVKAANNNGLWNEKGKTLRVIVKPAYWETWSFYIGMMLLFGMSLLGGIQYYHKRVLRRNLELKEYNNKLNKEIVIRKQVENTLRERDLQLEHLVKVRTQELEIEKKKVEELLRSIRVRNEELELIVEQRTEELKAFNQELSRSNKDLEQFAYMASHDLQEPLRMISSFVGILARKYQELLPPEALEYIQFAKDGADRMTNMIQSLLIYSRVGQKGMVFEKVNLHYLLYKKIFDLRQLTKERNVEIFIGQLPEIIGEKNQIAMVFHNLISNAIKYNKAEHPIVEIHASKEDHDEYWAFSIKDNGIGIRKEDQEKIFEIFGRLHSNDEYKGTGLGLALCQKIILSHGGQISLTSEPGAGTTFHFTISKQLKIGAPKNNAPSELIQTMQN